ncbi:2-dehydropantoate 2-reductase [Peribacillus kribbensis]|uniref:2-dehydropantoate 2-reductase n=1 Tax=Peribacillus kribbensis TaxID=356658 RepID=UPI000412AED1|nr:2-dehydropantoate 2-reductase [Peribacillus kribbensis]
MNIGVIGGGSIGLLFCSYLSKDYHVTLYTRTEKQAAAVRENGIVLEAEGHFSVIHVESLPVSELSSGEDLLLVCVKEYHLDSVMPYIEKAGCPVLFMQNGMGHLTRLQHLSTKNIGIGITEHGALKKSANHVQHTGIGVTRTAIFRGEPSEFDLNGDEKNFRFVREKDYYNMMLKKLIVNVCINPLTAVLGAANGELLTNSHFHSLFLALFDEVMNVLEIEHKEEHFDHIVSVCKATAGNKSSMLRDIEEERQTEIDSILGYVLGVGEKKRIEPALSKYLYSMIKGKELKGRK